MKVSIKILLLFIMPAGVAAQKLNPDILRNALNNAKTDSAAFFASQRLYYYYAEEIRDTALFYTDISVNLAHKNGKKLDEAFTLAQKGYLLSHLNKYGESYKCFSLAFKLAEDPKNENKNWYQKTKYQGSDTRLSDLAMIHLEFYLLQLKSGKTDQLLFHLFEANKIAAAVNDSITLSETYKFMGWAYLDMNKLDSALIMADNALLLYNAMSNTQSLSEIFMIKGRVNLKSNNYKQAATNLHLGIYWAYDDNDLYDVSGCYTSLIELYLDKEKNKDSSLYYSRKYLDLLIKMGSKDLGIAYLNLYKSYKLNNNIDSAYKYLEFASPARDSSYETKYRSLAEFQNLSFDDKFRLQELEKEKIQTQSNIRTYAMLTGLGVFLLIGVLLYRNNRQKQKANKVLESTLTNLKSTQTQLIHSEKMASLGELTAGIAHEIQNPLNFVNNFSEVSNELIDEMNVELDKGDITEAKAIANDVKQNLEKINHHGKRADAIVKGMLQHSRSSSGVKEPTDINTLCDEYLRLSYHGLRAKDKSFNATMNTDFDNSIGKINIIPQDIGRVVLNLINNAYYAVDEKKKTAAGNYEPTVSISTKKINGNVEIKVTDNGNGIPQNIVDKIFQPFFTTKPTGQGTGLGLSLSYDIVKAHGGEIKVETKQNDGTTFIIHLHATT